MSFSSFELVVIIPIPSIGVATALLDAWLRFALWLDSLVAVAVIAGVGSGRQSGQSSCPTLAAQFTPSSGRSKHASVQTEVEVEGPGAVMVEVEFDATGGHVVIAGVMSQQQGSDATECDPCPTALAAEFVPHCAQSSSCNDAMRAASGSGWSLSPQPTKEVEGHSGPHHAASTGKQSGSSQQKANPFGEGVLDGEDIPCDGPLAHISQSSAGDPILPGCRSSIPLGFALISLESSEASRVGARLSQLQQSYAMRF
jgi:hypothetical protein